MKALASMGLLLETSGPRVYRRADSRTRPGPRCILRRRDQPVADTTGEPRPMAKRTRYPGRPAPHRTTAKGASSNTGAPRPVGLTSTEVARAAELEAELVAREREAIKDNARRRARTRSGIDLSIATNAAEPLSIRAAHEYAYVARDVRRIVITAIFMFSILAVLWLLVNVGGFNIF